MRFLWVFVILGGLYLSSLTAGPALAQGGKVDCGGLQTIEWREARTHDFAFLYPSGSEALGQVFSRQLGESLDAEYARFDALFETSLSLPINVRLYPTESDYYCLNAQPPEIPPGGTHSHIGAREIALILENIADPGSWLQSYENVFRYELGTLFTEQVSGGRALPGLLVAVGHFSQDPAQTIGLLQASGNSGPEPLQSWRSLWEESDSLPELSQRVQAASIVAYLVDVYGWTPFLQFLQSLQTSDSYRQSLTQAFGKDFAELEEQWREYFPYYYRSRWQTHIFYNYDLSPYEKLIDEEKYSEAQKGLEEVTPFLERTSQVVKLHQAQSLLEEAKRGQAAAELLLQSRQALQNGEYQRSIDLINAYRHQAQKILFLHDELERLRPQIGTDWNTLALRARVVSLGQQLSELGDVQGHAQLRELAVVVETRQRQQQLALSLMIALVVLLLLAARVLLLRRLPSPEAQL